MNRRLALETCREEEEINVKSFVKLQSCLEEVRENKRTHLKICGVFYYDRASSKGLTDVMSEDEG